MSLNSSLSRKDSSSLDEKLVFVALDSDEESGELFKLETLDLDDSDDLEDTLDALLDEAPEDSSKESNERSESESLENSSIFTGTLLWQTKACG